MKRYVKQRIKQLERDVRVCEVYAQSAWRRDPETYVSWFYLFLAEEYRYEAELLKASIARGEA